jgi:hypothetical protein
MHGANKKSFGHQKVNVQKRSTNPPRNKSGYFSIILLVLTLFIVLKLLPLNTFSFISHVNLSHFQQYQTSTKKVPERSKTTHQITDTAGQVTNQIIKELKSQNYDVVYVSVQNSPITIDMVIPPSEEKHYYDIKSLVSTVLHNDQLSTAKLNIHNYNDEKEDLTNFDNLINH